MSWNIVQNADGTVKMISTEDEDATGGTPAEMEIGRGTTDPDITYIALRNATGVKCYIHPDGVGTAIVVTTTKP